MMNRKNKKLAIKTVEGILEFLYDTARLLPLPLETPHMWARRLRKYESGRVTYALNRLRDQGKVRITRVGNQKFIRLTELGQLQVLLLKSVQNLPKVWDKKWRVIIFDIRKQADSPFSAESIQNPVKTNWFCKVASKRVYFPVSNFQRGSRVFTDRWFY